MYAARKLREDLFQSPFSIESLTDQDKQPLYDCILETFTAQGREPMALSFGVGPREFREYAQLVAEKAIQDKLSLIYREKGNRRIFAFCIGEDILSAANYLKKEIHPRLRPMLTLQCEINETYVAMSRLQPGEVIHLSMIGVQSNYSRQGFGYAITKEMLDRAKDWGFRWAIMKTTSSCSHAIAKKCGFNLRISRDFRNFVPQSSETKLPMKTSTSCHLMEMGLGKTQSHIDIDSKYCM